MKKLAIVGILIAMLTLVLAAPVHAAVTENIKVPVTWYTVIPCNGHILELTGVMHIKYSFTSDNAGGYHFSSHVQPQKLQGVDIVTGEKYNGVGLTRWNENVKPEFPYESTFVNNYRMIGQGNAPNFMVHETWHITINASGNVTANPYNVKITCK